MPVLELAEARLTARDTDSRTSQRPPLPEVLLKTYFVRCDLRVAKWRTESTKRARDTVGGGGGMKHNIDTLNVFRVDHGHRVAGVQHEHLFETLNCGVSSKCLLPYCHTA